MYKKIRIKIINDNNEIFEIFALDNTKNHNLQELLHHNSIFIRTGNANVDFATDDDVRESMRKDRERIGGCSGGDVVVMWWSCCGVGAGYEIVIYLWLINNSSPTDTRYIELYNNSGRH